MAGPGVVLLDTGPWVALHRRDERHHPWAREQFARRTEPVLTCEAVVAETCFLPARGGHDPAKALALVSHGLVRIARNLDEVVEAVKALFGRYSNVPSSLADACLIRLSEKHERCRVMTLDSDFHVYRRNGRKVIPLLRPA
jgi:uncharacterized protein